MRAQTVGAADAMGANDAVAWHDSIADSFHAGYARSPRFQERFATWSDLIARYVHPGDHVLDAGCGAGIFSFEAAKRGAQVRAIDGSAAMIALAQAEQRQQGLTNVEFEVAALESLSTWPRGSYDVILSSSVLEYLPDLSIELARLVRLLKPGGRLILSLPNRQSLFRMAERAVFSLTGRPRYLAHVQTMSSRTELSDLFRAHGLYPTESSFYAAPSIGRALRWIAPERRQDLLVMVGVLD